MPIEIPEVVIERLPVYARALTLLAAEGRDVISSHDLGLELGITPAQIRKDLSYFGRFGKQGRGYNVHKLLSELQHILGLDREWSMALVGVGQLGRAILGYQGFAPQGFKLVAAFDASPSRVGESLNGLRVSDVADLPAVIEEHPVDVGIVAVPAAKAQGVIDMLVSCAVPAILNYAPVAGRVPPGVHIRQIDPVLALQSMTYHLKQRPRRTSR